MRKKLFPLDRVIALKIKNFCPISRWVGATLVAPNGRLKPPPTRRQFSSFQGGVAPMKDYGGIDADT
jgi:hypothetical protein